MIIFTLYVSLDYYFAYMDTSESTTIEYFTEFNYRIWFKI